MVWEAFGGKGEAQASVEGVFACAEQEQGEDEGFGILGGSSALGWEGVLLVEALDEGVDRVHRQGGEGGVVRVATLHRVFDTRCHRFFEQPLRVVVLRRTQSGTVCQPKLGRNRNNTVESKSYKEAMMPALPSVWRTVCVCVMPCVGIYDLRKQSCTGGTP